MAYLRWVPGSHWYVYWSTESGDTKETQVLCIDCTYNILYVDIKEKYNDIESIQRNFGCGIKPARQLKEAFDRFIEDVDKKFYP